MNLKRLEQATVAANRAFVALLLAAVFLIVFVNVVGRYGFGVTFSWAEETARHLMILGALSGAGLALREGRTVAFTALQDRLPPRLRAALRWLISAAIFAFMAAMLRLGVEFAQFGWNKETMSTGIPRGIPYLAIPVGCSLFLVQLAFFARRFVAGEFELDEDTMEDRA